MHLSSSHRPGWQHYLFALLAVAAAFAVRFFFLDFLGPRIPFVTYLPALVVVYLFSGALPALVAFGLSSVLALQTATAHGEIMLIREAGDRLVMVVSLFLCILCFAFSYALRRARQQATRALQELELADQRRAHQESLLDTERRYRCLFDNSMDAVMLTVPDGRVTAANPAACEMFGMSEQELCFLGRQGLLDQADPRLGEALAERAMLGRVYCELTAVRRDGSRFPVEVSSVVLEEGRRSFVIMRDITERKEVEESLRRSEAQLRQAQEIARVGSWSFDSAAGITWSDETYQIYGVARESFHPTPESFLELIHPEDRSRSRDWMASCDRGEDPGLHEFRVLRPDGSIRYLNGRGRLISRPGDPVLRVSGTVQDVTEAIRAAEDKERLESQLQQAQKMEAVGRLAGGVAHDFNNMLSVIIGHANLALMDLGPGDPLRNHLEELLKASERSAELTRQLLAFARKQAVAPRMLDLNQKVSGMLRMLQRVIGEGIQLAWHPGADIWPVKLDPAQIDQVLAHLCVHARDSITGQGTITIATGNRTVDETYCSSNPSAAAGEYVRLSVSDDGRGMDGETLTLIFEPFFTTRGRGVNNGLGLAMVYGVVRQNRGFIEVNSSPGAGARFDLHFPRYLGDELQLPGPAEGAPRPGAQTILVVEDEPALLNVTAIALGKQGYKVLAASSPGEALELERRHSGEITMLLTDVVMPQMNGRDLARELQQREPRLKCLFMSGYTADVIAVHGVLDEGLHFLQKPFTAADLFHKVRQVLDET